MSAAPTVCGAGHRCCGVVPGPPLHDHFLDPETCPKCWDHAALAALDRLDNPDDR